MFYNEGDLKSGIDKALRESKMVACLVIDTGSESNLWEFDYLEDPVIKEFLAANAVLLRLEAGSHETNFLAALVPIPKAPTLVLIDNGNLKEYIAPGTTKQRFKERLFAISPASFGDQDQSAQGFRHASSPRIDPHLSSTTTIRERHPTTVQAVLAERSKRLAARKKEEERKEQAKREKESKARQGATASSIASQSSLHDDMKYAVIQKKRHREAKEERTRILKRIEDDKAARREKATWNRHQRLQIERVSEIADTTPHKSSPCELALSVRLFDGSTVKSRFPSTGSIAADLRPFLDGTQMIDAPYSFKQVLTPLPNRDIAIGEENRTFVELGLPPSATFILLPVKDFTLAYTSDSYFSVVRTPVWAALGLLSSGVRTLTKVLENYWSGASEVNQDPEDSSLSTSSHTATAQDYLPEDQHFYNGNALNFEPRRYDSDETD